MLKLYNGLRTLRTRLSLSTDTGHRLGIRVVPAESDAHGSFYWSFLPLDIRHHRAPCVWCICTKGGRSSFKILQMNTIRNQCRPPNISENDDPLNDPRGNLLTGSRQCAHFACMSPHIRTRRFLQDVFRIWRHTRSEPCVIEIQMSRPRDENLRTVAANITRWIPCFAISRTDTTLGGIFESHLRELLKVHQCCTSIAKHGFFVAYKKPILSCSNSVIKIKIILYPYHQISLATLWNTFD